MDRRAESHDSPGRTLVLGATGKTGRRVVAGLQHAGVPVNLGSRSASPPFDWGREEGWDACLEGVEAVYVSYSPDLAVPGATDAIRAFVARAEDHGVRRLVLLSGRGEEEAQACERIVQDGKADWTIVRASWFHQNFSEGAFVDMVLAGQIRLPGSVASEPFVDADDIADVAVAALSEEGHAGEVYEVTGPRLLSFDEVAAELSQAIGRQVQFVALPHDDFVAGVRDSGAPREVVWMMDYLFSTVLDGRNAHLTDGVQRALGRPPRDFADFAREFAASGGWAQTVACA